MNNAKSFWLIAVVLVMMAACTPKVVEVAETVETAPPPPKVENPNMSKCPKFSDSDNPDEAETAHVLYRDMLKMKQYEEAFPLWEKAIAMAPAADGLRDYHYMDGVKFYEWMYGNETDEAKQKELVQKILGMYDKAAECYPKKAAQYEGYKAFKLYYKYPDVTTKDELYGMFKSVADDLGEDMPYFTINPFTSVLVERALEEKVTKEEAQKYQRILSQAFEKGISECEGRKCEPWEIIKTYSPVRLQDLETIKGFYDCAHFENKYYGEFEASPNDCDAIETTISRLKWGGCAKESEKMTALYAAYKANCRQEVVSATPSNVALGGQALRDGNYDESIRRYEEAIAETDDIERKASFTLRISKIYYVHKRKFSKAREYALKAAELRPNWGEPYLLIGRLYASSGPLCGPGTGFDSQRVVWAAIDMWNKAKSVDPAAAGEARKFINEYAQYMPNKEDIFIRNLKVGDTYKLPCWIQRNTKIRAATD